MRVERADDAGAGQILRRGDADALLFHFLGDLAVARGDRIAGVEHHLAGKLAAVILADLRIGAIGHGDENDIAERDRFGDRAALGQGAEPLHQRREFFGMAGGEHHGMAGLHPERADRAADMAGSDDADFQRRAAVWPEALRETAEAAKARPANEPDAEACGD